MLKYFGRSADIVMYAEYSYSNKNGEERTIPAWTVGSHLFIDNSRDYPGHLMEFYFEDKTVVLFLSYDEGDADARRLKDCIGFADDIDDFPQFVPEAMTLIAQAIADGLDPPLRKRVIN